jgi:hypothetical protein
MANESAYNTAELVNILKVGENGFKSPILFLFLKPPLQGKNLQACSQILD